MKKALITLFLLLLNVNIVSAAVVDIQLQGSDGVYNSALVSIQRDDATSARYIVLKDGVFWESGAWQLNEQLTQKRVDFNYPAGTYTLKVTPYHGLNVDSLNESSKSFILTTSSQNTENNHTSLSYSDEFTLSFDENNGGDWITVNTDTESYKIEVLSVYWDSDRVRLRVGGERKRLDLDERWEVSDALAVEVIDLTRGSIDGTYEVDLLIHSNTPIDTARDSDDVLAVYPQNVRVSRPQGTVYTKRFTVDNLIDATVKPEVYFENDPQGVTATLYTSKHGDEYEWDGRVRADDSFYIDVTVDTNKLQDVVNVIDGVVKYRVVGNRTRGEAGFTIVFEVTNATIAPVQSQDNTPVEQAQGGSGPVVDMPASVKIGEETPFTIWADSSKTTLFDGTKIQRIWAMSGTVRDIKGSTGVYVPAKAGSDTLFIDTTGKDTAFRIEVTLPKMRVSTTPNNPQDNERVTFTITDEKGAVVNTGSVNIGGKTLTIDGGSASINIGEGDYTYTVSSDGFESYTGSLRVRAAPAIEEPATVEDEPSKMSDGLPWIMGGIAVLGIIVVGDVKRDLLGGRIRSRLPTRKQYANPDDVIVD